MVTVSGTLYGDPVEITRADDGTVTGDTDLVLLTSKLVARGMRVNFWPLGDTTASFDDDFSFAITAASSVEGAQIDGLKLDEPAPDPAGGQTIY
jgi:hypothetical protein